MRSLSGCYYFYFSPALCGARARSMLVTRARFPACAETFWHPMHYAVNFPDAIGFNSRRAHETQYWHPNGLTAARETFLNAIATSFERLENIFESNSRQ